jgi:hypothetical protein
MDISLTVKSIFDNVFYFNFKFKVYNDSIEKALKFYVKPTLLEKDNKYFCSKCNEKVNNYK